MKKLFKIFILLTVLVPLTAELSFARQENKKEEPKKETREKSKNTKEKEAIQIKETEPIHYCAIEMTGDYEQHSAAFSSLYGAAMKQGIGMDQAPFGIYWNNPKDTPVEKLKLSYPFKR